MNKYIFVTLGFVASFTVLGLLIGFGSYLAKSMDSDLVSLSTVVLSFLLAFLADKFALKYQIELGKILIFALVAPTMAFITGFWNIDQNLTLLVASLVVFAVFLPSIDVRHRPWFPEKLANNSEGK